MPSENRQGPKFKIDIEGTIHDWDEDTITTEQIISLGGWDPSLGAVVIDLKTNEERPLKPGEVVELKPGMGFSKKIRFKRGLAEARIEEELVLLRQRFPGLEYIPAGRWVRIPAYAVPPLPSGWNRTSTDVVFQIKDAHPGTPPYGIFVPAGIRFNGATPQNYTESAGSPPPFPGTWGVFSWQPDPGTWRPAAKITAGANLLNWVEGFAERFRQGA